MAKSIMPNFSESITDEILQVFATGRNELLQLYFKPKRYNPFSCLASPIIFQHFRSLMRQKLG